MEIGRVSRIKTAGPRDFALCCVQYRKRSKTAWLQLRLDAAACLRSGSRSISQTNPGRSPSGTDSTKTMHWLLWLFSTPSLRPGTKIRRIRRPCTDTGINGTDEMHEHNLGRANGPQHATQEHIANPIGIVFDVCSCACKGRTDPSCFRSGRRYVTKVAAGKLVKMGILAGVSLEPLRNPALFGIFHQSCYQVATKTELSYHNPKASDSPSWPARFIFSLDTLWLGRMTNPSGSGAPGGLCLSHEAKVFSTMASIRRDALAYLRAGVPAVKLDVGPDSKA